VADTRDQRGLLDTSVLAEGEDDARLPGQSCVSALSLAELAAGPHVATDAAERARRQLRLQLVEATVEMLPFDERCARAYGTVYATAATGGRKPRGRRAVDLMIAATAVVHEIPLYTRNARDLAGLDGLLEIVDVGRATR
jgi:predicted nucleic acid-binding protein